MRFKCRYLQDVSAVRGAEVGNELRDFLCEYLQN